MPARSVPSPREQREGYVINDPFLAPDCVLGVLGRYVEDMAEEASMRSMAQGLILGTVCLCSVHAFAQGTLARPVHLRRRHSSCGVILRP